MFNLVNEIIKFEPDIFVKVIKIKIIKNSFKNLFIFNYKTYIFKGIFNKISNNNKRDFVLNNIIIIERFYINIVFKTKFLLTNI